VTERARGAVIGHAHGGKRIIARGNTTAVTLDGRTIEVTEVLDAWLAPDHRYFKVRDDNGACYILRNDVVTGRWELTMFDRTGAIG
jgi:hypothetical protein